LGSNRPESWSLLSLSVSALMMWCVVILCIKSNDLKHQRRLVGPGLIFLSVVVFIVLQTLDLGPDIGSPIWSEIEALTGIPVADSISVNPHSTRTALMRLMAYAGIFWIAFSVAGDGRTTWKQIQLFTYASLIYAAYGIVVYFAGNETILWYAKWAYLSDLTSTFVNRNTYGTFAGLGILSATACLIRELSRLRFRTLKDLTETPPQQLRKLYFFVLTLLLASTALFLTHSRGGILACLSGLVVLIVGVAATRKGKNLILAAAAITGFSVLSFSMVISGDRTLERLFFTSLDTELRDEVYSLVLQGIDASPIFGWGYGTFEEAFRLFYSHQIGGGNWDKAHNSYLELIFELGWPFAFFFLLIFLVFVMRLLRGAHIRKRHRDLPLLGLGIITLSAAHAFVDFSHQIPAVAVVFAWLLGLILAQSWPTEPHAYRSQGRR